MSRGISSALLWWAAEFTKFAAEFTKFAAEFTKFAAEFVKFCRGKLWALLITNHNWQHWIMFKFKETVKTNSKLLKLIKAVAISLSRRSCLEPCRPGSYFSVPIWPHLVQNWPQVDFKSMTCTQNVLTRLGQKQPTFDFGKKQPTFDFKLTSDLALCCFSSFIIINSTSSRLRHVLEVLKSTQVDLLGLIPRSRATC